jgi:hypothetical protein
VHKYFRTGQATDDNIIRRMHFACWIPTAKNAHTVRVIRIAFSLQGLHERASMLCYSTLSLLLLLFV